MTEKLIYEEPSLCADNEVRDIIKSGDSGKICDMLVALGLEHENMQFVESIILELMHSDDYYIASVCLLDIGYLAMRFGDEFDTAKWLKILEQEPKNPELKQNVEDCIADLKRTLIEVIVTDLYTAELAEPKLFFRITKYEEEGRISYGNSYIDKNGKEWFNGEYEDINELFLDVEQEFGIHKTDWIKIDKSEEK
ncbi:MAG: hypothetical protein J6M05_05830 [Cardiobacteriaceae bacterium]|nr:hypothetical protein [Cardiobacteriaceae bacterium]